MKAPDKIYIRTGMSGLLYGSKEKSFETDVEYIRKDAILAIIQSRLSEIIGDAQPKPILRAELEELVKKIKSL